MGALMGPQTTSTSKWMILILQLTRRASHPNPSDPHHLDELAPFIPCYLEPVHPCAPTMLSAATRRFTRTQFSRNLYRPSYVTDCTFLRFARSPPPTMAARAIAYCNRQSVTVASEVSAPTPTPTHACSVARNIVHRFISSLFRPAHAVYGEAAVEGMPEITGADGQYMVPSMVPPAGYRIHQPHGDIRKSRTVLL